MRKFFAFLICFACLISLFAINTEGKDFSVETYLTNLSVIAEDRPNFPTTKYITDTIAEYDETQMSDDAGIFKAIKYVWITLKVIYQCVAFTINFIVYIAELMLYIFKLASASVYYLVVW